MRRRRLIKVHYVQLMARRPEGMIFIGQPISAKNALKIKKELFGNDPHIVAIPSVPLKKRK